MRILSGQALSSLHPHTPESNEMANTEITNSETEANIASTDTVTEAGPPFNKPSADLILRTSDNVKFHVWKFILEEVSPVFAAMFVPGAQPVSSQEKDTTYRDAEDNHGRGQDSATDIPFVHVSETSTVLRRLLLTLYPPSNLQFASLDELGPVLAAARKYQMGAILDCLAEVLVRDFAKAEPLRVYCIATLYDIPLAQRTAARHFLAFSTSEHAKDYDVDELRDIDGRAYHRLLSCRWQCTAALAETLKDLSWFPDDLLFFTNNKSCSCASEKTTYALRGPDGTTVQHNLKRWFFAHIQRMTVVLQDKPSSDGLKDPALCDQTLKDAFNCGTCRGMAFEHMRQFMKLLEDHVEETVSQIITSMFGHE
ncbi:hypothetical protein BD309DRAFT_890512 [Dichomitus squalens]|uniref:Uncharacterized protein n=1 Tax=Dichomitus squalens TaxID=114155 RepID=A0A4Q9PIY5_9APHY|nr:hypothetical protein BD309DRAFT_890512 [Dichomitus squalens]TBU54039.1 hypothetical protein BD310DRAFT_859160 [Dichomitus squalens]